MKKTYILYPCGKKVELKVPILTIKNNKPVSIPPEDSLYLEVAKSKFEVGNLKVIQEEVQEIPQSSGFISTAKKIKRIS